VGTAAGGWLRQASYLQKWLALGILIGVIAGLGAIVFYQALRGATQLLLSGVAGYQPPGTVGEGGGPGSARFAHWWLIPVLTCAGGLVSGVLVFWLAPEAEGHGTDAAIDAVHRNPRTIRSRAVVVKLIASAVTIGSGGSGGREGPTAQISAGFGSLLARTLDLSAEDGRIAVSVGIGSGIGAIFGAPLGGAVLAADIVYRDDFEVEALIPGLITSIVGYTVFGFAVGFTPLFGYAAPGYEFHQPIQLGWFAIIGVLAGAVGLLYSAAFYRVVELTARVPGPRMLKPAIGGLLVGLLALALPHVLGTGYGWVQHALTRPGLLSISLWVVLLLPFAKILATSLSIGTGGSGGIFGPGMVIGAFVGAAVWRLLEPIAPGVPDSPAPFVVVGMMACFGSIARAPLAMMLMVAEMTGSLTILTPAMVAVGLAYLIVRRADRTIYRSQPRNREQAQTARLRLGLPLLARVPVAEAMATPRLVLSDSTTVAEALSELDAAGVRGAPVIDDDGRFVGRVDRVTLAEAAQDDPVSRSVDRAAPSVSISVNLDQAVDALPAGLGWLSVLDERRQVRGVLAISDVVRAYHRLLRADTERFAPVSAHATISDIRVEPGSALVEADLNRVQLPDGAIVLSVRRAETVLLDFSHVRLQPADLVTVLARPERMDAIRHLLAEPAGST
jgi:H+/Cl- antiporter ClcA